MLAFSHLTILKHGFTHVFLPHPSTFDQEVHPPAIVWRQINFLVTFESACVCLPGPAGFVCFLFFHCCAAKLETAPPCSSSRSLKGRRCSRGDSRRATELRRQLVATEWETVRLDQKLWWNPCIVIMIANGCNDYDDYGRNIYTYILRFEPFAVGFQRLNFRQVTNRSLTDAVCVNHFLCNSSPLMI